MELYGPLLPNYSYLFQKMDEEGKELTMKVEKKIGQGGFGVIYLIQNNQTKYALKFLGIENDLDSREAFQTLLAEYNIPAGGKSVADLRLQVFQTALKSWVAKTNLFQNEIKYLMQSQ